MELAGATAVVIGGGSGIGRGIALGLVARGVRVALADIDPATAEAVVAELTAAGGEAAAYQVDATDRTQLDRFAGEVQAAQGSTQILVNTVGAIFDRPLAETEDADWGWIFEFNVLAMMRSVQAFLPQLREHSGAAHVVLTSSSAGLLSLGPDMVGIHNGLYTTTKHALVGLADMLRSELAPEGIGVSVLCPGLVAGNLSVTSARNRPERFGGPLTAPERRSVPLRAMPNEAVGPLVAAAIEANRFYIFTHPEVRTMIEARHQALLEDIDFYAALPS
jgi:NAD(P)-dependent dehydrogenase (short-subunit alcohol dehydrogenase family)